MPVLIPAGGQKLAVNGTDLSQYAVILNSMAPLMHVPAKRNPNITVPGRHGTIRTPRKRYSESDFVLTFYVLGSRSDGTVPSGSTAAKEFYARVDALLGLFQAETVQLSRTMPDSTVRQATVEVVDKMDWTRNLGMYPLLGQVAVAFTNPSAFWAESTVSSQTIAGTTGTTATLTAFTGSTAPISDVTLTWGPCSNPSLIYGSAFVQYNGVIAAGQQLVINTANWSVGPGTGTAWSPDIRNVAFGPGPTWLELVPSVTTGQITHTGGGSASCTVAAARRFLSA